MLFYFDRFIELLILPPSCNLLILITGWIISRWWKTIGKLLISLAVISLWLLASPLIAQQLIDSLQKQHSALSPDSIRYDSNSAIVVLEAGLNLNNPEYNEIDVSGNTFKRLRYAAFLHSKTKAPILVSGNDPTHLEINQADFMAKALKDYFNVAVRWKESEGFNTAQEAIISTQLLRQGGVKKIYLVTHALHMPRSVYSFQNKGLEIIPAPTSFITLGQPLGMLSSLFPSTEALHVSAMAIREYLGLIWYHIYYHF